MQLYGERLLRELDFELTPGISMYFGLCLFPPLVSRVIARGGREDDKEEEDGHDKEEEDGHDAFSGSSLSRSWETTLSRWKSANLLESGVPETREDEDAGETLVVCWLRG